MLTILLSIFIPQNYSNVEKNECIKLFISELAMKVMTEIIFGSYGY